MVASPAQRSARQINPPEQEFEQPSENLGQSLEYIWFQPAEIDLGPQLALIKVVILACLLVCVTYYTRAERFYLRHRTTRQHPGAQTTYLCQGR